LLAFGVYFALREVVAACANHKTRLDLTAPATPEKILMACKRAKARLQ
jgi:xanthine dehydrogenase large subunit